MDQRERRKRKRRLQLLRRLMYVFLMVWGILGLVGLFTLLRWAMGTGETAAAGVQSGLRSGEVFPESQEGQAEGEEAAGGKWGSLYSGGDRDEARRIYQKNPALLVLVNKDKELDVSFDPRLRSICNGRLQASERMYDDLAAMLSDAGTAGYEYWIASAYRSRERQQELIDEDVEGFMEEGMSYEEALGKTLSETMPAGYSEHETGLALDILCSGNTDMDVSQATEPGNRWLLKHCAQYGFILRYPLDRVDTTGIAYEPWHFRYVGREAAEFIMDRGLVLEDFWEILAS